MLGLGAALLFSCRTSTFPSQRQYPEAHHPPHQPSNQQTYHPANQLTKYSRHPKASVFNTHHPPPKSFKPPSRASIQSTNQPCTQLASQPIIHPIKPPVSPPRAYRPPLSPLAYCFSRSQIRAHPASQSINYSVNQPTNSLIPSCKQPRIHHTDQQSQCQYHQNPPLALSALQVSF